MKLLIKIFYSMLSLFGIALFVGAAVGQFLDFGYLSWERYFGSYSLLFGAYFFSTSFLSLRTNLKQKVIPISSGSFLSKLIAKIGLNICLLGGIFFAFNSFSGTIYYRGDLKLNLIIELLLGVLLILNAFYFWERSHRITEILAVMFSLFGVYRIFDGIHGAVKYEFDFDSRVNLIFGLFWVVTSFFLWKKPNIGKFLAVLAIIAFFIELILVFLLAWGLSQIGR